MNNTQDIIDLITGWWDEDATMEAERDEARRLARKFYQRNKVNRKLWLIAVGANRKDLIDRLTTAQAESAELRRRIAELEADLDLAKGDYKTFDKFEDFISCLHSERWD